MDGEAGAALIASRPVAEADPPDPQPPAATDASLLEPAPLQTANGQVTARPATGSPDSDVGPGVAGAGRRDATAQGAPAEGATAQDDTHADAPDHDGAGRLAADPAEAGLRWHGARRRRVIRRFWLSGRFWVPYIPMDIWLKPLEYIRLPQPRDHDDHAAAPVSRPRALLRQLLIPAAVVLTAAVGGAAWAFVAWGPVGLGNGPVSLPAAAGAGFGWTDTTGQPVALVVPIINSGHAPAVIDSVSIQSGVNGSPATLLAARAAAFAAYPCQAMGPMRDAPIASGPRRGSVVTSALGGCVRPGLTAIAGLTVPAGSNAMGTAGWPISTAAHAGAHGTALVLEFARPAPRRCWSVVAVVIRYRVGTRHYISTSPLGRTIACSPDSRLTG